LSLSDLILEVSLCLLAKKVRGGLAARRRRLWPSLRRLAFQCRIVDSRYLPILQKQLRFAFAALTFAGVAAQPVTAQMTTRTTTVVTPRGAERTTVVRTPVRAEQRRVVTRHTVVRTHTDSGWHANRRRKVCAMRWRHGHRIRVCNWR